MNSQPKYSILWSFVYNFLLFMIRLVRIKPIGKIWMFIWTRTSNIERKAVKTVIHGESVLVNYGNSYPVNSRMYRNYNCPLIEAAYQVQREKERPIRVIDVGAAIGDTVLLLNSNCPGMIEGYVCVDGDREFFSYLQYNTRNIPNCMLFHTMLSGEEGVERSLVRTHSGTASAQGGDFVSSIPLDALQERIGRIDLIKVDVDGFDGKVLSGAINILTDYAPAVLFEWHPALCVKTGNDVFLHFEVLQECGYSDFLWYTKEGSFSHFMHGFDRESIQMMADLCIKSLTDLHFDVVAVHSKSTLSLMELAEMNFAVNKKSRC